MRSNGNKSNKSNKLFNMKGGGEGVAWCVVVCSIITIAVTASILTNDKKSDDDANLIWLIFGCVFLVISLVYLKFKDD